MAPRLTRGKPPAPSRLIKTLLQGMTDIGSGRYKDHTPKSKRHPTKGNVFGHKLQNTFLMTPTQLSEPWPATKKVIYPLVKGITKHNPTAKQKSY